MKTIGVQKGLSNVADYLTQKGYTVKLMDENIESAAQQWKLDAIVSADYNTDAFGYSDTYTKVPVINASGLTAEEVETLINNNPSQ